MSCMPLIPPISLAEEVVDAGAALVMDMLAMMEEEAVGIAIEVEAVLGDIAAELPMSIASMSNPVTLVGRW